MKKSILISALGISILLLSACNESTDTPSPAKVEQKKEQEITPLEFSQSIEKGNLWLSAFRENFGSILSKKNEQPSSTLEGNIIINAKKLLDTLSANNKMTFDINTLKFKDDMKGMQVKSKLAMLEISYQKNVSESQLKRAKESFDYMKTLSPSIPELDKAGEQFGITYINLYEKTLALGDYLFVNQASRLDDYAQASQLYDDLKKAYKRHTDIKKKTLLIYDDYYKKMHLKEMKIVKNQGQVVRYTIMESMDNLSAIMTKLDPNQININMLEDMVIQLETRYTELETTFNNSELLKKEYKARSEYDLQSYLKSYQQFILEIKNIIKDKNEGNSTRSALDRVSIQYELLVRSYNALIF